MQHYHAAYIGTGTTYGYESWAGWMQELNVSIVIVANAEFQHKAPLYYAVALAINVLRRHLSNSETRAPNSQAYTIPPMYNPLAE